MPASRTGRRLALATTLTGLLAAPLAVVSMAAPAHAANVTVQILATNDFHGRLQLRGPENRDPDAGAAVLAGAVKKLEADNPTYKTVFAAAGDLIGASTFESFIQKDKPTIDALNEADLDVSAAGNHEFDGGVDDLVNRVMKPYDATTNPYGGAKWQYIAANVRNNSPTTRTPSRTPAVRGLRHRPGRLRGRRHRGPAGAREPRWDRDDQGHQHHQRGEPQRQQAGGPGRRRHRAAGPRGCSRHLLRVGHEQRQRLRPHRERRQPQHRRHRLGPHPPALQPLRAGPGLGGTRGHRAARRVGRSVRPDAQPAPVHGQPTRPARSRPRRRTSCRCSRTSPATPAARAQLPGRPGHHGDRGQRVRGRPTSSACGRARQARRPLQAGASSPTADGEPWW